MTARFPLAVGLGAALAALTLVAPALAQGDGRAPSAFGLQFAWPDQGPPEPAPAPAAPEDCPDEEAVRIALAAHGYEDVALEAFEHPGGGVLKVIARLEGAPVSFLYDACADLVLEALPAP